jgi:cofilin
MSSSSKPVENHTKTGGESLLFKNTVEVSSRLNPECKEVFKQLKIRRKGRYILFKLGDNEIEVDKIGDRNETYETFKKALPYSECRYCIFDQDYKTNDGRPASKLWFINWFPDNSTTYHKMAYTSAKPTLYDQIEGVFDTQVASVEELDVNLGYVNQEDEQEEEEAFDF